MRELRREGFAAAGLADAALPVALVEHKADPSKSGQPLLQAARQVVAGALKVPLPSEWQ